MIPSSISIIGWFYRSSQYGEGWCPILACRAGNQLMRDRGRGYVKRLGKHLAVG